MSRSTETLSKYAKKMGLKWDRRHMTEAAAAAVRANAKRRRAELADLLVEDAHRLREQMWKPMTYWDWGGKDHEFDERDMDQPNAADQLKLMQATNAAVQTYAKLDSMDNDAGASEMISMLGKLAESLGVTGPVQ